MNESPDTEFDLEKLFLPAWAQESPAANKYAGFSGDDRRESRSDDRHGPRRGPPRFGGDRPQRGGPGGGPRGPRPEGARRSGPDSRDDRHGEKRSFAPRPAPAPPAPPPQLDAVILPEEKGMDSLARQIRITGRAYPLFDIAQLILQKPERQTIRWEIIKDPAGKPLQPLFLCALDESLWMSEDEAVAHLLSKYFDMFYQAEKTATEPPKGTYTFVAQCGMSGQILGPPNCHDYQIKLHKLHNERFSRMPFEAFKARVKIVRDEAVVKKWIEDQSTRTEYIVLNVPEPLKLPNREAVEKHFRETHLPNLVKPVESHTMSGPAARLLRSPGLQRVLRAAWEEQRRFPLKLATTLSQQFASRGLQFFKVNRSVTHVCVARPHFLDMEATPVSEGVRRIVEFINATSKCNRRKLVEALVPHPVAAPVENPPAPPSPDAPATEPAASPEQTALAGDLHWLIHEGHVIEFANGILETAKRPVPKPPKPPKPAPAPAATPPAETPTAADPSTVLSTVASAKVEAPSGAEAEAPSGVEEAPPLETPPAPESTAPSPTPPAPDAPADLAAEVPSQPTTLIPTAPQPDPLPSN